MAKQTEADRIKAIPGKEMVGAIKSINEYLAGNDGEEVVVDKKSKANTLGNLLIPIVAAIEAGDAEKLPDDVIAFYNDHLVVEEEEAKPAKAKAKAKAKKEPKPKKPSNEQNAYDMVKAGKSDAEIAKHFEGVYAGKDKDAAFIAKRAAIYTNIAKRKFASEDAKFAKAWAAEKEAAKPKKAVKEKAAKKDTAKKDTAKKEAKPAASKKVKNKAKK